MVTLVETVFKRRESFQDFLCRRDYSEKVVASFDNQIQSEYYGVNRSVSTEVIALEHFSALTQTEINLSTKPFPQHAVFLFFFKSDDSKQGAATTTAHIKRFIYLLK